MKTKYKITQETINKISDDLHDQWKEIKWKVPENSGDIKTINEAVKIHNQLELLYKIIRETTWNITKFVSPDCHQDRCDDCKDKECVCECHIKIIENNTNGDEKGNEKIIY